MIGSQFGRLTVIQESEIRSYDRRIQYLCKCACGNEKIIVGRMLKTGKTRSCGCLRPELLTKKNPAYKHPLYNLWIGMKQRCYNPKHTKYDNYGGRGITVCDEWLKSFWQFAEDMGERPSGCSIDRKDNNGNYEKSNCRWATDTEQANNRRPKFRAV